MTDKSLRLLKQIQEEVNKLLVDYFDRELKSKQSQKGLAGVAIKNIRRFILSGGKRVRPAVMYYAYLASGGKKRRAALKASLSIELIHSFLLMHDDIIDKDDKRHGISTIHKHYEKIGKRYFADKDIQHFGRSMAIIVGDLTYSFGNKILFSADFKPEVIVKAMNKLQDIVYDVIDGEMLDVQLGFRGQATEKEIIRVQKAKTAYYTFDGPIALGQILAESNDKKMAENFTKYSLALGRAFQIRDDILGIFGDEKKLGKPVGSDITEGKRTLLTNYIVRYGSPKEKKIMNDLLGRDKITTRELKLFQNIMRESGSLEYSQQKVRELTQEAVDILDEINFQSAKSKEFFRGIAEYLAKRDK